MRLRPRLRALEELVRVIGRLRRRHAPATAKHLETGRQGELAAYFYLRRLGYTVVARDWRSGRAPGDIDLIAWEGDTVCFIEVKTRSTRDIATAEAAVGRHKRHTLRRLAGHYLRQLPDGTPARFDVLSIYFNPAAHPKGSRGTADYELFRGAFDWEYQS